MLCPFQTQLPRCFSIDAPQESHVFNPETFHASMGPKTIENVAKVGVESLPAAAQKRVLYVRGKGNSCSLRSCDATRENWSGQRLPEGQDPQWRTNGRQRWISKPGHPAPVFAGPGLNDKNNAISRQRLKRGELCRDQIVPTSNVK